MSIPQKAVSRQERYNTCHRHVDDGWMEGGVICETDTKVCYLFDPEGKVAVLLYCENK